MISLKKYWWQEVHSTVVGTDTQIWVWTLANLERENLSSEYLRDGSEADIQTLSSAGYKVPPPFRGEQKWMERGKNEVEVFFFLSYEFVKCPPSVEIQIYLSYQATASICGPNDSPDSSTNTAVPVAQ